ncbi:MAG TPA: hypothetical protein VNC50_09520, partial [Planctomycetia bacterium]|nr:hypothetical protein [Planctomycetia bacterium]
AKAGCLFNYSRIRVSQLLSDGPLGAMGYNLRHNDDSLAGIFEAAVGVTLRPLRHFAFRGGYQVLAVTQLSLAFDQRVPNILLGEDIEDVRQNRAIYHGPYASVEITWGGSR